MDLTNLADLKAALTLAGLSPNKAKSQNFLVDREALSKIVSCADLAPSDVVLEIGSGPGVLTQELVKQAKMVYAIEADPAFAQILSAQKIPNLAVEHADFLQFDLSTLPAKYKVVANLPYAITSAVIKSLLNAKNAPEQITILVQKEVAERICAKPGAMSVLALSVQYYGEPKLVDIVPSTSFYPVPKVDSAILHINLFSKPAFEADASELFRLIKIGFSARRKMLKNNLEAGLGLKSEEVITWLKKAGVSVSARAQELSLDEWQALYQCRLSR